MELVTSFDIARAIIGEQLEDPSLDAAPYGYEDRDSYHVIVTEPPFDIPMTDVVTLVSKRTGIVHLVPYADVRERLEAMTPVGEGHPA